MDETEPLESRAEHHRRLLNRRLPAAFIEGAEEDARRRLGRGLTEEELERVLRQYPGDPPGPSRSPDDGDA